jgi:phage-related baseplate assembly protein
MRGDVRVLTDTVMVVPAEILHVNVQARIWLYPDAPIEIIDAIAHEFPRRLLASAGLGWDLTQSWIISELHKDGVHKVELSSPTASIRALAHQAVRLTSINLEFAGRDR